jgi:hypothetical protein
MEVMLETPDDDGHEMPHLERLTTARISPVCLIKRDGVQRSGDEFFGVAGYG